jgi:hypothetical protein
VSTMAGVLSGQHADAVSFLIKHVFGLAGLG